MNLPPLKSLTYDEATTRAIYNTLSSYIVLHPAARTTYQFYEVVDAWLGPWGPEGYLIGYGKFYNIAFNTNKKLLADPTASSWVTKTTILLQESLRDYIVFRARNRTLKSIIEPELRAAAFASHAKCYTDGGLAEVVMLAPELIPIIVSLPGKEFHPLGPNFGATVSQVFETLGLVAGAASLRLLTGLAGPAHTGVFARASYKDGRDSLAVARTALGLTKLGHAIDEGQFDSLEALEMIVERLERMQFGDRPTANLADDLIRKARLRISHVQDYYREMLDHSPPVRRAINLDYHRFF